MSDNNAQQQRHALLELGMLGFTDDCVVIGDDIVGRCTPGNNTTNNDIVDAGDPATYQQWFVLSPEAAIQLRRTNTNINNNTSPDSDSGNQRNNIRFVAVALRAGSRTVYHTKRLHKNIGIKDMEQFTDRITESFTRRAGEALADLTDQAPRQPPFLSGSS